MRATVLGMLVGCSVGPAWACQIPCDPCGPVQEGSPLPAGGPPIASAITEISISGFQFVSDDVTVRAGDTVRWTNRDSINHSIVSQVEPGTMIPTGYFTSADLYLDEVYEFVFDLPGTYYYFCGPHGNSMEGTIRVLPAELMGDANGDSRVNTLDFNILSGNFGLTGVGFSGGDFDRNGTVESPDFVIFLGNYGISGSPQLGAAVPEPRLLGAVSALSVLASARRPRFAR